jgi:uncharacterized protein YjbI with pentapeptide repeats
MHNSELLMTDPRIGRAPFPLKDEDNDYSGLDFDSIYLIESKALSHAFLNGTSITNSVFAQVALDQCEFGEAQITQSSFVDALLDGADFVRTTMSDGSFENCDLTDGEWRESTFCNVQFVGCKFSHTTVNLCKFVRCQFDAASVEGLDYKAVNYNVFSDCSFQKGITNESVLARNFGLKSAKASVALVVSSAVTLEQLCRISGSRRVTTQELVEAVEHECAAFHGRLKQVRLEFISNLIAALATEQRISPASLLHIENIFTRAARVALEHGDIQVLLLVIVNVRNAFIIQVNRVLEYDSPELRGICNEISIKFQDSYSKKEAIAWAAALDQILADGRGKVLLSSFKAGSTILGFDLSELLCSAVTAWAAVNLLLSYATVSIKRVRGLKRELKKFRGSSRAPKRRRKTQNQIASLLWSNRSPREVLRLRTAVARNGDILVHFDVPAQLELKIVEGEGTPAIKD